MIGERTTILLWHNKDQKAELISNRNTKCRPNLTECLERTFPDLFQCLYIVKTDNLICRNYCGICPEWMWKASCISKVPALAYYPGNLYLHLLWWTFRGCFYRRWFRMCCLINELHTLNEPEDRRPVDWLWSQISNRISDQGHRCKEAPSSYTWVTCNYLWRPYCKMATILQTSEHFCCIWNQIRIHKIRYISFFPSFWLSAAILRQRVLVQPIAHGSHIESKWTISISVYL